MRPIIAPILAAILVGCTAASPSASFTVASEDPTSTTSAATPGADEPTAASPTPDASGQLPTQSPRPVEPSPAPGAADGLHVGAFAKVVIPELNVRVAPSTSADTVIGGWVSEPGVGDPLPLRFGTASLRDDVVVLNGPVVADGYTWWQVWLTEYVYGESTRPLPTPQDFGWVAAGDGKDRWLIEIDPPCPASPVETADITLARVSFAVRLLCFGDRELTLRGWYAGEHPGALYGLQSIFPIQRGWEGDNVDRLDFSLLNSAAPLPAANQWLEIRGQFNHPSAAACEPTYRVLGCRATMAALEVTPLGR